MIIVFEGIDGCGKDTQIRLLLQKKKEYRYMQFPTKENPILNKFLEHKIEINRKALGFYFIADMLNQEEKIYGNIIINRYVFSTIAYQGVEFGYEDIKKIVEISKIKKPDLVIYLDITPEIAIKRKNKGKRNDGNKEYLKKVRLNYLKLYKESFMTKWIKIDASKSIEEIHNEIMMLL